MKKNAEKHVLNKNGKHYNIFEAYIFINHQIGNTEV